MYIFISCEISICTFLFPCGLARQLVILSDRELIQPIASNLENIPNSVDIIQGHFLKIPLVVN